MSDLLLIIEFVATAVWKVWPAFVISVFLGVMIRALKLDGVIRRAFSARIGVAILLATAVGAFSPFCSCTVIPVVSGLLMGGVPLAPVMAFWVASPTMDPEIFALSVATLGWPLAMARLVGTLGVSLAAGYGTLVLTRSGLLAGSPLRLGGAAEEAGCCSGAAVPEPTLQPAMVPGSGLIAPAVVLAGATTAAFTPMTATAQAADCGGGSCALPAVAPGSNGAWWEGIAVNLRSVEWGDVARQVGAQSWNLGRWLVLAFVMEALITLYVPQAAIAGVLGAQSPLAVPLAALVGVPLYMSNISALPIVSGLLTQGMQPGAAIAFLIAGPVTTVPAMTAVWGIARRQVFVLYLAVGLLGALAAGSVTNLLFVG
jgi:uncharacterized protein